MYKAMLKTLAVAVPLTIALAGVVAAQPPAAPQPPPGPYRETCTNIHVKRDKIITTLYATCAPSRRESSIPLPCVGEVINRDGELVCRPRR